MSDIPLGEIFFDIRFNFDPKTQKLTISQLKQQTKQISKQLEDIIAYSTAKGITKGAEEGVRKMGRVGFAGRGFSIFSPFNPKVMGAYFTGRYMHMMMNNLIFKPLDELVSNYFLGGKKAIKEVGTDPTKNLLTNLSASKEILPSMSTKNALFLEETMIGTGLKGSDIASELKKMIDAKRAKTPEEALGQYLKILGLSDEKISNSLALFGGSTSIAHQLKYSNVKDNLINIMSSKEFEDYANILDKALEANTLKEKSDLLTRKDVATSIITKYATNEIIEDIAKKIESERTSVKKAKNTVAKSREEIRKEAIKTQLLLENDMDKNLYDIIYGDRAEITVEVKKIVDLLESIYDVVSTG